MFWLPWGGSARVLCLSGAERLPKSGEEKPGRDFKDTKEKKNVDIEERGAVGPFHSVAEAAGCVQTTDWLLLTLLFFAVLGGYHVHFMLTAGDWDFWVDWKDRRMWPTVVPILGVTFAAASQAFFWVNFRLPFGAVFAALAS